MKGYVLLVAGMLVGGVVAQGQQEAITRAELAKLRQDIRTDYCAELHKVMRSARTMSVAMTAEVARLNPQRARQINLMPNTVKYWSEQESLPCADLYPANTYRGAWAENYRP